MLTSFKRRHLPNQQAILAASVCLAFALKIILSFTTVGTNDAATWYAFLHYYSERGGIGLYHTISVFNHPPFTITMLRIMGGLTNISGLPFYFWLRLPAILADVGSVVLVARLLERQRSQRAAMPALVLLACAPASLMISGFHGNTDPVMIFFLLLAIYCIDYRPNIWLAGIAFGMSLNIKVMPVVFFPAILLYLPNLKHRAIFAVLAGATFGVGGLPYLLQDPVFIATRLFGYDSLYGEWGVSRILRSLGEHFSSFETLNQFYASSGKWFMLLAIVSASIWMNRFTHKPALFMQCGLIAFLFLALAPGFGVQYLAWLVPWVAISVGMGLIYYLASGIFLFLVYTAWSNGFPWYFADSFFLHGPLMYIGLICWAAVVLVLIMYFKALLQHAQMLNPVPVIEHDLPDGLRL